QNTVLGERGKPLPAKVPEYLASVHQDAISFPSAQLSSLVQKPWEVAGVGSRSAQDAAVYQGASRSVLLVATNGGSGPGTLIDSAGTVITSWHLVEGATNVTVVFKPLANRRRALLPPSVPITAPTAPAIAPTSQLPPATPRVAPLNAPVIIRPPN